MLLDSSCGKLWEGLIQVIKVEKKAHVVLWNNIIFFRLPHLVPYGAGGIS